MSVAYVDTSALVAIAFGERAGTSLQKRLAEFEELVSSNLLEAELRAAFAREEVPFEPDLISALSWIFPNRPIGVECDVVLSAGYLRGADLWHIATALYLAPIPAELTVLTLDTRQRSVAKKLGFIV